MLTCFFCLGCWFLQISWAETGIIEKSSPGQRRVIIWYFIQYYLSTQTAVKNTVTTLDRNFFLCHIYFAFSVILTRLVCVDWLPSLSLSSSLSEPPTANIRPTPSTPSPNNKPSPSPGNKSTPRASIRPMVTPASVPTPTPTATVMPTTQTDSQEGERKQIYN